MGIDNVHRNDMTFYMNFLLASGSQRQYLMNKIFIKIVYHVIYMVVYTVLYII